MNSDLRLSLNEPDAARKSLKPVVWNCLQGVTIPSHQREVIDTFAAEIHEAIARGETGAISTLAKPLDNDDQRGRCPSLLFWAAVDGDCEIVDALLAAGADPNEAAYSLSALAAAARCGQLDVVRRLLEAGASITTSTNTVDALTCAVESQSEDVVETLIQAGADVNPKSMAGAPLLQAVKEGNIAIMKRLIAAGANIHFKWTIGNNLIGSAIGSFSDDDRPGDDALRDIIRTLVKHGVEIDAKNSFFRTPLMLATEANNEAAVETLLACGANPNIAAVAPDPSKDNSRFSRADHATALILAARAGHARIASRLIAAGADLDAADNSDLSALQWAKRNGHDEVIAVLVAAGAQADDSSPQALLAAARAGDLPAVQKALEAGLDVDVRDEVGALNEAIIGPTPLILAAAGGHGDIVAELLRSGADVDLQSSAFPTSISPLMAAAESGHIDVMEQLLAAGADVNLKNNGFEGARLQALHFAARSGQVEAAKLLLHHGARINAKNADKETPLHFAVTSGNLATVQLCLDAGADPLAKNTYDLTPRDSLRDAKRRSSRIGPLLQAAEASAPKKTSKPKQKKLTPAIPYDWEAAPWDIERPDFTGAATTESFQRAVALVTSGLGVEPLPLDGLEQYPGVVFFEISRAKAKEFINSQRNELAQSGAMAVFGLKRFAVRDEDLDYLMLLPTTDWEQTVAYIQTADPNGGKGPGQIVAGLRQLYELRPFYITQVAHDTIGGSFTAPAKNSRALAKWMEAFCSDIVYQGVGSISELARQLKESDQLFFWWD